MKINWKWPHSKASYYFAPWYLIIWRTPFVGLAYLGIFFAMFWLLIAYGKDTAIHFWKNAN